MPNLYLERLSDNATLPIRSTTHAACYDVFADIILRHITAFTNMNVECVPVPNDPVILNPGERVTIPTGWKMRCDPDYSIDLISRSGLPRKQGVTLANGIGIIDADYPGEVGIILANHSNNYVTINHGDRIAQLRLTPVLDINIVEGTLPKIDSNRTGGLGSTGR